jgi:hypothetical protein
MLRTAFLTLLVLVIAIGGGGASVWYALKGNDGIGAVRIGQWTAFPDIGTPDADPYSKARVAREGVLVLGRAEGLSFVAERDAGGARLRRDCAYTLEGNFPPARFWTLYAADRASAPIRNGKPHQAALHSREILRRADNSVVIAVDEQPAPGNWLAVSGSGPLSLVLTLYDTPIAGATGFEDIELPVITRTGCHA